MGAACGCSKAWFMLTKAVVQLNLPLRQFAARVAHKDLAWSCDLLLRVVDHLLPLCEPAYSARDGEHDWKHCLRKSHCLIDDAGIEVDVRVSLREIKYSSSKAMRSSS